MVRPHGQQESSCYKFRVNGRLDARWSAWFDGLTLSHESDHTTSLCGFVPDQAALHGLLMKVRDLGIFLISVEAIDPQSGCCPSHVRQED